MFEQITIIRILECFDQDEIKKIIKSIINID